MRGGALTAVLCVAVACGADLVGCGTDDGVGRPPDAGTDAGSNGKPVDMLPRRDAAVDVTDPVTDCVRNDPNACADGQRCEVIIRRAPDVADYTIQEACVTTGGVPSARGLGDPCDPFGGLGVPYEAPGLTDIVYIDPCGDGLFCAPDLVVRGLNTCQPACASAAITGYNVACGGEGEYCSGSGVLQQVCRKSDGCNPADPTSCGPGRGCYLRFSDDIASVLSICFPAPDEPVADGEGCIDEATGTYFINACNPGASCWGPVRSAPATWQTTDYLCRRACDPDAIGSGADAGDEDAGAGSSAGCRGGQECADFSVSGLGTQTIDADFGHCE